MEADVCECRQLEKYFRNELACVKNKLMNTSHFYERSALEVSDPVPRAFPCHKGKPFEDVSHVAWLLWIIDISRRP